jgi:hypothetical protein
VVGAGVGHVPAVVAALEANGRSAAGTGRGPGQGCPGHHTPGVRHRRIIFLAFALSSLLFAFDYCNRLCD